MATIAVQLLLIELISLGILEARLCRQHILSHARTYIEHFPVVVVCRMVGLAVPQNNFTLWADTLWALRQACKLQVISALLCNSAVTLDLYIFSRMKFSSDKCFFGVISSECYMMQNEVCHSASKYFLCFWFSSLSIINKMLLIEKSSRWCGVSTRIHCSNEYKNQRVWQYFLTKDGGQVQNGCLYIRRRSSSVKCMC